MAKLERTLHGDFNAILTKISNGIVNGSVSASLEDTSDFGGNGARCSVRVFERYSYAGGSQALFWKVNTWGEETFLEKLREIIE